jgi:hypothetical protein
MALLTTYTAGLLERAPFVHSRRYLTMMIMMMMIIMMIKMMVVLMMR